VARTELGVAIGSVLVVAAVLAIPVVYQAPVAPYVAPHILPKHTPTPTGTATDSLTSDLVGTGCAAYTAQVPTGGGSIVGMSQDPLAVAASNNPMLTTLTSAISGKLNAKVNLVSTLDSGPFTVFAPVDTAFAKLPPATIKSLGLASNAAKLTSLLEYHVVPNQLLPANVDGTLTTVEGGTVTVAGSGDNIKVNGANVICGGIHTANATVYLIDTVLSVPAK
jgi:uncharacterized surface protein with fasciclin (FAS1) repeats